MSDYNKSTNFTSKDTLPTGNSGKIVKGTELDIEFTNISSAIASKANSDSPTFTGTPAAPTATTGSNTTQLANTAFVKTAIDNLGTIGTMASQSAASVAITGGTITGITDLAVADGGTGRSTLTDKAVLIGAGTSGINSVAPGSAGNVLKSDGTNWTSAAPSTVRGLGLGGETWHDVTGSRSIGTDYTNNNSYPIMVSASNGIGNGPTYTYVYINGSQISRQSYDANGAYGCGSAWFIVPPGATYRVSGTGGTQFWWELY